MAKLAINGGPKIREKLFPAQETTGIHEATAASKLIHYGILSGFRGNCSHSFYGGDAIQKLENRFRLRFNSTFAAAVNSCTSGLQIACGAIGLEPGDEVIVTPWSMSCSATAPMVYGATPIFADLEPDYYCISKESFLQKINHRTKAIIAVDLFGQTFDPEIRDICNEKGIFLIEDAAQAIGATANVKGDQRYAGTIGDIGCFSFTQGKHLTSGEGGMMLIAREKHKELAMKSMLIRNHAEAVMSSMEENDPRKEEHYLDLVGYNMRLTEVQAAIIYEQLKKLDEFISMRQYNIETLSKLIAQPGITPSPTRQGSTHVYYVQSFKYDDEYFKGVHRDKFLAAVRAELVGEEKRLDKGVPIGGGYITPLYLMPLFQRAKHPALKGYKYSQGDCPVAEILWKDTLFTMMHHNLPLTLTDVRDLSDAFQKVVDNIDELTGGENE